MKVGTKVADLGVTKDRGAQTKSKAKQLRLTTNLCHFCPRKQSHNYSPVKPDSCFMYEGLALQHYDNKTPDDELSPVPCLDTEARWLTFSYLL